MSLHKKTVEALIVWIEENLHLPLTIDDVSKKAGYSRWHLQRIFRRVTKRSLGEYIRERRIRRAAEELMDPDNSILTIAVTYGYESQQSFTRIFTRYFQHPPAQWRNNRARLDP